MNDEKKITNEKLEQVNGGDLPRKKDYFVHEARLKCPKCNCVFYVACNIDAITSSDQHTWGYCPNCQTLTYS